MRFRLPCGQLGSYVVLVGESAEDLFPVDPVVGEVDRLGRAGRCLGWGQLAEGAMRPGRVVVHQVLGQHPAQVLLVDDQQPVEEFPAQGADDPFADRVRSGSLRRAGQDPGTHRGEHGIEMMPRAWAVRNCFQVGPERRGAGWIPAAGRICQTVEAAIR
jgi:hypothetical protein